MNEKNMWIFASSESQEEFTNYTSKDTIVTMKDIVDKGYRKKYWHEKIRKREMKRT